MKRTSVEEECAPNRGPRPDSGEDNIFDETRRKTADDLKILNPQIHCEFGNLEAGVCMVFPCMGEKRQVILEIQECSNIYRFHVFISAKVDVLHPFPFSMGDRICLSLKGAQSRTRTQSSAPGYRYLPIALTFNDGITAKLVSGPEAGKVFNTWEGGWLGATPDIPRVRQDSTEYAKVPNANPPSESLQPENVEYQMAQELAPVLMPLPHRNPSAADISQSSMPSPERELTKAQKRRRQRQAAKGELPIQVALEACLESTGHEMVSPRLEVVASAALPLPVVQSLPQVLSNEGASSSLEQTSSLSSNRLAPIGKAVSLPIPGYDSSRNRGPLAMKAGITTHGGDQFMPIRDIQLGFFNVIGVVTSTKPPTSMRTQEWTRVFSIVDPSCMEDDADFLAYKFTVNCFQKKHVAWLP
ncbi:hypothetical protein BDR03DRAFT_1017369 [Suillus americanus]|nr:hypothetical protein BDR03DRAFT_1017369 [Suillus americanus]